MFSDKKNKGSKQITLKANSTSENRSNMINVTTGRKTNIELIEPTEVNDLNNWILDSGCTCHMTPYPTDFLPGSLEVEDKLVEIADGFTVPATQSGTILMEVVNDNGEKIFLNVSN